jgi:hypothetical protein
MAYANEESPGGLPLALNTEEYQVQMDVSADVSPSIGFSYPLRPVTGETFIL